MLRAGDSLADGQQGGELVAGPGRISRLSGPAGELVEGVQGVGVLRAGDSLADGQQGGELVAGPGRISRLSGPAGEFVAGVQGVGVLRAEDPLADGQQGGELIAGPSRISCIPGPAGEFVAGVQGVGVFRAVGAIAGVRVGDQPRTDPGPPGSCRCTLDTGRSATCRGWSGLGRPGHAVAALRTTATPPAGPRVAGTAASTRAAAAFPHWLAASVVSCARVTAWTRRCTRTRPSPAGVISE